jgi:hypothetical protein
MIEPSEEIILVIYLAVLIPDDFKKLIKAP